MVMYGHGTYSGVLRALGLFIYVGKKYESKTF
nr:MAG TPA: hypothetical protein [Caudoviricetes sp.]